MRVLRYSVVGFGALGGALGLLELARFVLTAAPGTETYLFLVPGLALFGGMLGGAYFTARHHTFGVPLLFSVILPQAVGWQTMLATWIVSSPGAVVLRSREGMVDLAAVGGVEYQVGLGEHVGLWLVRVNLLALVALGLLFVLGAREQHSIRARPQQDGGV
jgi:hypothetical protein